MKRVVPLTELKQGKTAVIARIEGEAALKLRLMERGLLPGERVKAVKRAPLGDPIELALEGSRLSIRKREAETIFVIEEEA